MRSVYPEMGLDACCRMLPGRSREAIRQRVSEMKLPHPSTWTAGDDAALRRLYPLQGPGAVARVLGRSIKSIYSRACRLGVHRENADRGRWPGDRVPEAE